MGLYRRGKIWHIQYFMNGRRGRESTGSPSKEFAQKCLDARKGDRARNKFDLPGDSPRGDELAKRFLDYSTATLKPYTVTGYRGIMKLRWSDIDMKEKMLMVKSMHAKSGRVRAIPIPNKAWLAWTPNVRVRAP